MKYLKLILPNILVFSLACMVNAGQSIIQEYRGLQTTESPLLIDQAKSPDMDNVDLSNDGLSVERRKGLEYEFSIAYPTHTIYNRIGAIKTDTYDRLVVPYGPHVEVFDRGFNSVAMIHSSATVGYAWDFAQYNDNLYATNGQDTIFYTTGDTKTFIPTAPKGTSIAFYNNTCFISDVANNRARLYYSVYADPTDWTTGTSDTDGDSVDVANYGERIVDLEVLGDSVLILCSGSIMKAIGTGNPYQIVEVDKSVGCKSKGSVSTHLGITYFLGTDGIMYKTDGITVEDISSDDIEDEMSAVSTSVREANYSTISSKSDFDIGITSYTSTSISDGDIVLYTGTTVYTSADDFSNCTLTAIDTTTVPGTAYLNPVVDDFNDGNYTSNPTWTPTLNSVANTWTVPSTYLTWAADATSAPSSYAILRTTAASVSPTDTIEFVIDYYSTTPVSVDGISLQVGFKKKDNSQFALFYYTNNIACGVPKIYITAKGSTGDDITAGYASGLLTANVWHTIILRLTLSTYKATAFVDEVTTANGTFTSGTFPSSIDSTWDCIIQFNGQGLLSNTQYFDTVKMSREATIVSPIIDTTATLGFNLLPFYMTWSSVVPFGTDREFFLRTSNSATMADDPDWIHFSSVTYQSTNTTAQYVQIKSSMTATYTTYTPLIQDITLTWATTGYYISPEIYDNDINSFGLLEVDESDLVPGEATINYFAYSSNTIVSDGDLQDPSVVTWTAQTNNDIIGVSTDTYVWIKAVYSISYATQTPKIGFLTVNWISGSDLNMDITTMWANERMYMGTMTDSSSSINDRVFVFDPMLNSWWAYSGIYPVSMRRWYDNYLVASSSSGVVYSMFDADTDNGTQIDAYYKTKYLYMGSMAQVSSFDQLSVMYDSYTNGSILVDTYLNGSTTASNTFRLSEVNTLPIIIKSYKFPQNYNGYYMQYKVYNENGDDFKFHILQTDTHELPSKVDNQ